MRSLRYPLIGALAVAAAAYAGVASAKLGSCNDPILLGTTISETGPFSTLADKWRKVTEVFAEEVNRTGGILVKGASWGREKDSFGVAFARNGLSAVHRDYLAAGGLGFFIGDGQLNYQPEIVFETFYTINLRKAAWVTLDWQNIRNPAYNADRGSVDVASLRLHTKF